MSSKAKVFSRDFILVIIGQIISLFGNAILRFALPLYILEKTGSGAIFGSILAIAVLPTILFSPFGGILADRVNKRNIMVYLDFFTALIIGLFGFVYLSDSIVIYVGIMMVLFSVIQAFYQPSVQASIPVLVAQEHNIKANAVVNMVNSLSNLLGPVLGGVLYSAFGMQPVIIAGGVAFFVSAVMEIFIHIPFEKRQRTGTMFKTVCDDLKESFRFITKERPIIIKIMIMVSLMNMVLFSLFLVGLPIMITQTLKCSAALYGAAQGMIVGGAILGGVLMSAFSKRHKPKHANTMLFFASLGMIPVGIALMLDLPQMVVYGIIVFFCFFMMMLVTMFSISMMSLVQQQTPKAMVGKVISFILALFQCALPVGQAVYGFLFDAYKDHVYLIVLAASGVSMLIVIFSRSMFAQIEGFVAPSEEKVDVVE